MTIRRLIRPWNELERDWALLGQRHALNALNTRGRLGRGATNEPKTKRQNDEGGFHVNGVYRINKANAKKLLLILVCWPVEREALNHSGLLAG